MGEPVMGTSRVKSKIHVLCNMYNLQLSKIKSFHTGMGIDDMYKLRTVVWNDGLVSKEYCSNENSE